MPLRIVFDHREDGGLLAAVVVHDADADADAELAAFGQTAVDPAPLGAACMSSLAAWASCTASSSSPGSPMAGPAGNGMLRPPSGGPKIADLARRVAVGAVLTAPVLFGVMARDFFHPAWLPAVLSTPGSRSRRSPR